MGYTHGTPADAEFRICTKCGQKLPNTKDYFNWSKTRNNFVSVCRECNSAINKEKKKIMIEQNKNKSLFYEGTKKCFCCGRDLPNNKLYFPIDLSCVSGLRNKCRECDPKNGRFLEEDYKISEKWSDEDLQILKANYQHYTNRELQEKFFPNRTIRAIECEAQVLGWNGKTDETYKRGRISQASIVKDKFTGRLVSDEWREKISENKKRYYETHDGWWKGRKRSSEQCKQISERRKGQWTGDKNPRHNNPLNGENNGRWKGGINNTYFELRSDTKEWQQESMEFCNYKCVITGGEFHNVHHVVAFRKIVDDTFAITNIDIKPQVKDYSEEEFEKLRNTCKELHNLYGYGACINEKVHKLFHKIYGYMDFIAYDFLVFIRDIDCGKYNKWFEENNLLININYEYIDYLERTLKKNESA